MAAVRVLNGDIAEKITKIKQQEGPDLHVYGSANLVQTLLKNDLVDVLWLKIYPITLGGGKRLFADGTIPAAFKGFCCGQFQMESDSPHKGFTLEKIARVTQRFSAQMQHRVYPL